MFEWLPDRSTLFETTNQKRKKKLSRKERERIENRANRKRREQKQKHDMASINHAKVTSQRIESSRRRVANFIR